MARISRDQISFLNSQQIPLSRVFNASGMSRSEYQKEMRDLEMVVAYGVTACEKGGHSLRTRAGHCAQCNPAALAFLMRFEDQAEVYVANSKSQNLTKIGVAKNHIERLRTLNSHGYGGSSDWKIHFVAVTERAGLLEFLVHQLLDQHRTYRTYVRTGKTINCQELFSCPVDEAIGVVRAALSAHK